MAGTDVKKVDAKKFYGEDASWDWDSLEDHEKVWARDHNLLNPEQRAEIAHLGVSFGYGSPENRVSNDPTILAEQQLQQSGLFEQMVEERAKEMAKQMMIAEQQGNMAVAGENTGRVDNAPVHVDPGVPERFQPRPARVHEGETEDAPPYEEWSNEDLRTECKARGLSPQGPKADLVARLNDDDTSSEGTAGDEDEDEGNQGGQGGS